MRCKTSPERLLRLIAHQRKDFESTMSEGFSFDSDRQFVVLIFGTGLCSEEERCKTPGILADDSPVYALWNETLPLQLPPPGDAP
jgi:hypothetical protein